MAFFNRNKNWEDEYDEYYTRDRQTAQGKRPGVSRIRILTHLLALFFVGVLFAGAVGSISGPTMMEKMLTELAMPVGIIWLLLFVMVYFCLLTRQAWPAVVGLICWLFLSVAGNDFFSNWLVSTLERPFTDINVYETEPLDTIVLLGGGTVSRADGQAQLNWSGDRVSTAARLYQAGKVTNLICTGSNSFSASDKDLHPREEAAEILIELGVPADHVRQLKGKNTSEEMRNLKTWIDENPAQGRVGILTSAWHLPRALRLAAANDMELIPVPCDFHGHPHTPSPNVVVPGSKQLTITSMALKEYLAGLVGR